MVNLPKKQYNFEDPKDCLTLISYNTHMTKNLCEEIAALLEEIIERLPPSEKDSQSEFDFLDTK